MFEGHVVENERSELVEIVEESVDMKKSLKHFIIARVCRKAFFELSK